MPKLPKLTLGHLYRFEELSGKDATDISTNGVKDIGLLLYVMAGEPEAQKPHEFLNQYEVSDLKNLANELKGALKTVPLASVPKAKTKGTE